MAARAETMTAAPPRSNGAAWSPELTWGAIFLIPYCVVFLLLPLSARTFRGLVAEQTS